MSHIYDGASLQKYITELVVLSLKYLKQNHSSTYSMIEGYGTLKFNLKLIKKYRPCILAEG